MIHLFERPQSKYGRVQSVGPVFDNFFFNQIIHEDIDVPCGSSGCGGP